MGRPAGADRRAAACRRSVHQPERAHRRCRVRPTAAHAHWRAVLSSQRFFWLRLARRRQRQLGQRLRRAALQLPASDAAARVARFFPWQVARSMRAWVVGSATHCPCGRTCGWYRAPGSMCCPTPAVETPRSSPTAARIDVVKQLAWGRTLSVGLGTRSGSGQVNALHFGGSF